MKTTTRSALFPYLLVLILCFLPVTTSCGKPVTPQVDVPTKSIMDMVPYDSLAYLSLSNMDKVYHIVTESPEWEELLAIEEIQEQLDQAKQPVSFVPMLLGITAEEFLGSFGRRTRFPRTWKPQRKHGRRRSNSSGTS